MTKERFLRIALEEGIREQLATFLWHGLVAQKTFNGLTTESEEALARDALRALRKADDL